MGLISLYPCNGSMRQAGKVFNHHFTNRNSETQGRCWEGWNWGLKVGLSDSKPDVKGFH